MPVSKYKVELTQSERSALIETSGRGKPVGPHGKAGPCAVES